MSKLLQYLVNKPSVHHKVLPNLRKMQMAGTVLPKMQKAGQYPVERDATSMNTPALSKMFGAQREIDVNRFSEDAFKQKYKMTPHQYKMRTDTDYAQAFERQMDQRRQNDPNYSEINLPATDVRSKLYRGNPNLALIPKGATGPARAQQEQLFADMTSLSAPLLPVKSLVRGLQVGKAASTAPKIIDKLINTSSPIKTAVTQPVDNSGLIINDEVLKQWVNARNARRTNSSFSDFAQSSSETRPANIPSYMENWGTGNWNASVREPVQNIEPYRAAWEGIERRGPEWITQAVRDWPTSNMSFSNTPSLLSNVTRGIDQKLGRFFSKGNNAPAFDADEVTRLINENLSKGVGVKKENLPLQVKLVPTGYSPDDFRIETLIDNNKVGSIFFQRNMNPYKPKTFSQQFLNKAQSPFEKWQSTPGFRKKGDYPFSDYDSFNPVKDPTGKTFNTVNDLYNTGISGEFNKAINEAFKAKGLGNVLSGGTGHSKMGEARWQNLVKKGLAEDLGAGYFKLKKQGGPVQLPKMQKAGQYNTLPLRISIEDPRYPELYKNRQVASFYNNAFTLPDLPEVVVSGKDERLKEAMSQGMANFQGHVAELMGAPQAETMKFLTGKKQTPADAWGFNTDGLSWYNPKTVFNFGMNMALDPLNLVGVGIYDDIAKGALRASAQNAVSKTLQRGISPFGYEFENIVRIPQNLIRNAQGKSKKFSSAVQKTIDEGRGQFIKQGLKNREDAWSTYLGLDRDFNTMRLVGSDDATGLSRYEYTNPIVFEKSSPRPNPKASAQKQRIAKGLYNTSEGRLYNKGILNSDYMVDADGNVIKLDLDVPGSSTVGNDQLFGTMAGFQKYVSPDGKHLMYRDIWDLQPFSRLTSSQLPKDLLGNAIRRFEVSSLIPGAKPFVAQGKLGDIKTKFLPAQPYENIVTRYNKAKSIIQDISAPDISPEDLASFPKAEADKIVNDYIKFVNSRAKKDVMDQIKNDNTFLNPVPLRQSIKYVDTNPYTRFGSSEPDLTGFDFDPTGFEKLLMKIQNTANRPISDFKNGGLIVDPRGQWAHPGKRTLVPTPTGQITMKGVPYPVYGKDETGFGQMMYPGGEYKFPGQMVDEIPMMQFGGISLLGPLSLINAVPKVAKTVGSWFSGSTPATSPKVNIVADNPNDPEKIYGKLWNEYTPMSDAFEQQRAKNDMIVVNDPKSIALTSGRFKGAKVSPVLINEAVSAAKSQGIDPWLMLSVIGRESAFGSGADDNVIRAGDKGMLVSGWNVAENYQPYDPMRFLADNKVPGVITSKDAHGWSYEMEDGDAVAKYLTQHPELFTKYKQKISTTPQLGNMDSFDLAAKFLKEKGISRYNPGDTKYPSMVNADMNLLKNDAALRAYMKTLGYKNGGQYGGLDRWFAEKWVDVKTGKACGRQEGESRAGYPACRPSKRVSSETPKTSSEMSSAEKAKFKRTKTSSERIPYNHKK